MNTTGFMYSSGYNLSQSLLGEGTAMKEVNRRISVIVSIWRLCLLMYMVFGFPCALLISIASVFMGPSSLTNGELASGFFLSVVWLGALLPIIYIVGGRKYRASRLKQIVSMLSNTDRFNPHKQHQVINAGTGKYLGIDKKRGTILYIHMVKKGSST